MKRRDLLKAAGIAGIAAAVPGFAQVAGSAMASKSNETTKLETELKRLNLRHTWTTTMASDSFRETVHVHYTRDGVTGYGEAAPIIRYKEYPKEAKQAIDAIASAIEAGDPWRFDGFLADVRKKLGPNQHAAMAAIDIAVMDWLGKKLNVPLYRYFGLDPAQAPITTFSIGIDTPEITKQKTLEAADYPVLKVKVGLDTDEATIEAVRSVTKKPLRVDANEGWKDKEEAVRKINWLEKQGVEFIEQPLPAEMLEEQRWIRSRVHIPIFADEACQRASDIPKLKDAFDGVNVKLDKSGGMLEAFRMIQTAKALGMKTMLGCMISSSVTVTAAAHLSPLVDFADLDGN